MLSAPPMPPQQVTASADRYFDDLRAREFATLDGVGLAYLDYTGSALPAASQLAAHNELLGTCVFGNPHASSGPSRRSNDALEMVRAQILDHLDAAPDEYTVCFAANATGAVKLVAESYPFAPNGTYALSTDNHNSIHGIREFARRAGTRIEYVPLDSELRLTNARERLDAMRHSGGPKLFAFPAQSNFSGVRHPLCLIDRAHESGFDVLLDAAAYLPSSALSLRRYAADFVALSFYKLFGFPTGLGALVARRDALARLRRPWFAGGTVEYVSVQNDRHSLLPGALGFEDGTPHFLGVAAIPAGFALLRDVGMSRLTSHISRLTNELLARLGALQFGDGTPGVHIYGPASAMDRGSAIAFNVVRHDGSIVPYWIVEEQARRYDVALRGGCFCNPGAAESAFGFPPERAAQCLRDASAGERFTVQRFANCLSPDGRIAVGAVRASLGIANNSSDVQRAIAVVESLLD
jgi:selenocysteine lyase/cysteine desulfurase